MRERRAQAVAAAFLPVLILSLLSLPPGSLAGQEGVEAAEEVAAAYLGAIHTTRWDRVAERLHPEATELYRASIRGAVESRIGDAVLERLLGGVDSAGFAALPDREVFTRVMASLARETPGLIHALVARPTRILGVVPEDGERAHVVYRVDPGIEGEVSVVRVMTLAPAPGSPGGWAVLRSDELDVMRTAIHGIPVGAGGAGGPVDAPSPPG